MLTSFHYTRYAHAQRYEMGHSRAGSGLHYGNRLLKDPDRLVRVEDLPPPVTHERDTVHITKEAEDRTLSAVCEKHDFEHGAPQNVGGADHFTTSVNATAWT